MGRIGQMYSRGALDVDLPYLFVNDFTSHRAYEDRPGDELLDSEESPFGLGYNFFENNKK
jgi:hypothetical protein